MSSLTYLSLPRVLPAVLGLLWAASGLTAPAQEPPPFFAGADAQRTLEAREEPLNAFFSPGVSDLGRVVTATSELGVPQPSIRHNPDGTTAVTIRWDTNNGESIERRSAVLIVPASPAPEPTPMFLGACAGCVFLLFRRRARPSKLRPARVNLSAAVSSRGRALRPVAIASPGLALAPPGPREPRRHRLVSTHDAYIGRLFPRQPRLSKP